MYLDYPINDFSSGILVHIDGFLTVVSNHILLFPHVLKNLTEVVRDASVTLVDFIWQALFLCDIHIFLDKLVGIVHMRLLL